MKNRESWTAGMLLAVSPWWADAGVRYDVAVRSFDNQSFASTAPSEPDATSVRQYFVEDGKVRVGAAQAKSVYVFVDRTLYVIDNESRIVRVFKDATVSQVAAHYAAAVKQLDEAAASAAPEERAQAQRRAADMRAASERLRQAVPREFRMTARFESVDGHSCRIWEERENESKRLELCVAAPADVAGGAEILNGMKTLSRLRRGSKFALGVDFGLSEWWPDIAGLGGVPLLIREFKYESLVSETSLTAVRAGVPSGSQFDLPEGYQVRDEPDYAEY